ncbi:MAG TPA: hypothetical protein VGJ21_17745 [Terracidiphilus sp.]
MAFVLSPDGVNWQGAANAQVTIEADTDDDAATLEHVEYPIGTSIDINDGKATFKLIEGRESLLVFIKKMAPSVTWLLNEVGAPSELQALDEVDAEDPDPFSTNIQITGQ